VRRMCIEANCVLPDDVRRCIDSCLKREDWTPAKWALGRIVENYEIAERDGVPICQDTGYCVFFVELGQDIRLVGGDFNEAIDEGVRRGYENGYLRKSIVNDPVFLRKNTGDNTPAIVHIKIVPGDKLKITIAPKGGGGENMSALRMLTPSAGVEGIKQFVVDTIDNAGSNPCPPMVVGIGIGGTFEKTTMLAKQALIRTIGENNRDPNIAALEKTLLEEINALGIGPQGFGGSTTALAVHIETFPSHIASMPVAVNVQCHVARHKEVII